MRPHRRADIRSICSIRHFQEKNSISLFLFFCFFVFIASTYLDLSAAASTLVLEGNTDGSFEIRQERFFTVAPQGLDKLTFRFANPAQYRGNSARQAVSAHRVEYYPKPDSVSTVKDGFGNTYTVVTWIGLKENALVREYSNVALNIELREIRSFASFPLPLSSIPGDERRFLSPTRLTQSGDSRIKKLAKGLVSDVNSEQAAVSSLLNWVVDNVKYSSPVPDYSALFTLDSGKGNCQNFSHLSIALLKASGIPARIVGGIALGKPWRVPLKDGTLLQSIGQGGHAWIEVWYPDLGWVPYDAQQSHLFVGPRHIKQTVGLDSDDINDSWKASPLLPPLNEDITVQYTKDLVALSLKETEPNPMSYIMTSSIIAGPGAKEPPVRKRGALPTDGMEGKEVEFGNTDFPALLDFYVKRGDEGHKTFDKETAEFVTGDYTYAQAFTVGGDMALDTISLAMHKFGGRAGSLWIDVVRDEGGRPGLDGFRSMPLELDSITYFPGYRWFDFRFSSDANDRPILKAGRYWIVLRHSRDAIINWFYTPGGPGASDYARSTALGINWSNIMNYGFNFKVKGRVLAKLSSETHN